MQPVIITKIKHNGDDIVLNLPCKDSELQAQRDGLTEGGDARFYLSAIEPKGLAPLMGLEVNLDELNFLAKSMERFGNTEYDQFMAAVSQEKSPDLEKLINLSFNANHYTVIRDVSDLIGIGQIHLMNLRGGLTKNDLKTIDFAQVARNLLLSGRGVPTYYGLLFENEEVPLQQIYDGTVFPPYLHRSDMVALCTVDYGGKREYLYLPEEKISINKALGRLGADSLDACKIELESSITAYKEWQDWLNGILEHEGLDVLNFLAQTLDKPDMDWEKLTAVVHYADVVSGEDIEKLARHLDDFVFIKGAETDEDVGRHFVDHHSQYSVSLEVADFIDYDALGAYLQKELDSEWLDNGLVCMEPGCSLKHILNENTQNFTMGGY